MKRVFLGLIKVYQKTLSLDHSFMGKLLLVDACRFHPTCSEYTYQAIDKYGVVTGSVKGIKRIARCHPFNSGGYDPLD